MATRDCPIFWVPKMSLLKSAVVRAFLASAAVASIFIALVPGPGSAIAETKISGSTDAVTIDAQNSTVEEILTALGHEFDVHIISKANLKKQITGTYGGSLRHVLGEVLEGYNTVVKSNLGWVEVTIFASDSSSAARPNQVLAKSEQTAQTAPGATAAAGPPPSPSASSDTPALVPELRVAEGQVPTLTPAESNLAAPVVDPKTAMMPPIPTAAAAGRVPGLQPAASSAPMLPVQNSAQSQDVPISAGQRESSLARDLTRRQ